MFNDHYIVLWDGEPIGVDINSGGYPFKTWDLNGIKFWGLEDQAKNYVSIFQKVDSQKMYQDMVVYRLDIDIRKV